MTIQQMEYIVAVDKFRHFVKAAESCSVTQSTLSTMIKKLEDELDTIIFDRDAHPVRPTVAGEKIIAQAKVILYNTEQLKEMTLSEKTRNHGEVKLAIIPTVATNLVPALFKKMQENSPLIQLRTFEMQTCDIIEKLSKADLDMAIMVTPLEQQNLYEIPMYYERLYAYISPLDALYQKPKIISGELPTERLWALKSGNCLRDQVFNFCNDCSGYTARYEAGNLDTLIRIVDTNGGYTVVPELHIKELSEEQKENIRDLVEPKVVREVSLVIRKDFVRERILNEIVNCVKQVIPETMLEPRLKKFAIKL